MIMIKLHNYSVLDHFFCLLINSIFLLSSDILFKVARIQHSASEYEQSFINTNTKAYMQEHDFLKKKMYLVMIKKTHRQILKCS